MPATLPRKGLNVMSNSVSFGPGHEHCHCLYIMACRLAIFRPVSVQQHSVC